MTRALSGLFAAGALILASLTGPTPAAAQQEISRGFLIAQTCSGCHAADFTGSAGMPALRGRSAAELQTAMTEFRTNARYSTVMGRLSRGLTDDEIGAVVTYLAGLK
jgi:sulfide dehydrogenase cytochrome subunit